MKELIEVQVAEGVGFEPTAEFHLSNGLASRRLRPLDHPSGQYTLIYEIEVGFSTDLPFQRYPV
jgi:hypothetical protein